MQIFSHTKTGQPQSIELWSHHRNQTRSLRHDEDTEDSHNLQSQGFSQRPGLQVVQSRQIPWMGLGVRDHCSFAFAQPVSRQGIQFSLTYRHLREPSEPTGINRAWPEQAPHVQFQPDGIGHTDWFEERSEQMQLADTIEV